MRPHVLVTGGAGFIGSHTSVALAAAGWKISILDNFVNSKPSVIGRIEQIIGQPVHLYNCDLRDENALEQVFSSETFDAVIHFAALKAVGESNERPIDYYESNVWGTLALVQAMAQFGCFKLVFSSSATVYGEPVALPIPETHPLAPASPYGRTKRICEDLLRDVAASDPRWQIALLRYFNPVGAHDSGMLGEDPNGVPNNLFPYVLKVAAGELPSVQILGTDYSTPDGTGVRDYIHVMDLAEGHVAALRNIHSFRGARPINLGTGQGFSVREVLKKFEELLGRPLASVERPRRNGDVPACFANVTLAESTLEWRARRGLAEMCADAWRWKAASL
jgi:UDP-glucose 4-epimerase